MTAAHALGAALALLVAPAAAHADPWHLTLSGGTDFPISAGARLDVEGPARLRLSTAVGAMPDAYVSAINSLATAAGWYSDSEAALIRTALHSSLVWRTHLGWRPFSRLGFTVMAGYGLVALGGGASAQELIAGITGQTIPPGTTTGSYTYSVSSTLHMIDVELGWEWTFFRNRLVLSASLGFAGTVASRTTIRPEYTPRAPQAVAQFANYGATYLDNLMTSSVFTPVIGLGVGYRFF
ncbi:MAG: hypothetical protein U0325_28975 [Polyangiales bacterium]